MKIYRVVPNSFTTNKRLDSLESTGFEDIYYKMGYSSFLGKRGYHMYNSLSDSIKGEGKYFYLFFDDALLQGNNLIQGFHRLKADTCSIIEYDIPEDIILKNIGFGDYTDTIFTNHIIETFVEKSDLSSEITTPENLSKESKIETLTQMLVESLKQMKEYGFSAYDDLEFYTQYFENYNLDSLINDEEKLKQAISISPLFLTFKHEDGEILKTPYITKKIIPLNIGFLSHELHEFEAAAEYYQNKGIDCRISDEHEKFKRELLRYVKDKDQDKQKIKSLLRDNKYI